MFGKFARVRAFPGPGGATPKPSIITRQTRFTVSHYHSYPPRATLLKIMDIHKISRRRFTHTVTWAVVGSILIVAIAAGVARATLNLNAALIDKPDIAIYLLLPDEGITTVDVLRTTETQRDYMVETNEGPKLVILRKGEVEWYVEEVDSLKVDD